MSNEQNIYDILKLLRESVDTPAADADTTEIMGNTQEQVSADDLQKSLRLQYSADGSEASPVEESPYELDSDLLGEFSEASEENTEEEIISEEPSEESAIEEDPFENETVEEEFAEEEFAEDEGSEEVFSEEEAEETLADEEAEEVFAEDEAEETLTDESFDAEEPISEEPAIESEDEPVEETPTEENYISEESDSNYDEETKMLLGETPEAQMIEAELDEFFAEEDNDGEDVIERQTEFFESDGIIENTEDEKIETEYVEEIDTETAESILDDSEHFETDTEDYSDIDNDFELDTVENTENKEEAEDETVEEAKPQSLRPEEFPEYKPISFKALIMDYGKTDPAPEEGTVAKEQSYETDEEDTPDVGDILSDFSVPVHEEAAEEEDAAREFMLRLGCEDELKDIPPEAIREVLSEYRDTEENATVGNEAEMIKERREGFKKEIVKCALRTACCFVMTVILFLYDFLPTMDVKFMGIADYTNYPGAYVIFGAQLLILCAVTLWKPMIEGIKKLGTFYPDMYSMAVVIVALNTAYDTVFLISNGYDPLTVPMFHFLSATVLLLISVIGLVGQIRKAKAYDIYTSDVSRFTLSLETGANSIAGKMYSGGFSKEKKVYIPTAITSKRGFTKASKENRGFDNKIHSSLIFGAVITGIIVGLIFIIAGMGISSSAAAMMATFFVLLPIGVILGMIVPHTVAIIRLSKRGIALTGKTMMKKYADANVMVFNDMHLFTKCDPKSVGFVSYDKRQTGDVIASLQILYSRIGGPMADAFDNLPEDMRAKRIRVRRIAQSGVEALVDKQHVLIVGDRAFLRRYGIEFPSSNEGSEKNKNATIYVSLNGRASAKISARYEIEPVFDMLIERLSREGGHCVIETYDPVINTAFVSSLRKKGHSPISVVHKNAADINTPCTERGKTKSDNGILAVSSRYKLIEAVVWCNRIRKIEKWSNIATYVTMGIGFVITLLLASLGITPAGYQFILLGYGAALLAATVGIAICYMPRDGYFTVDALRNEERRRDEKQRIKAQREAEKIRRKNER